MKITLINSFRTNKRNENNTNQLVQNSRRNVNDTNHSFRTIKVSENDTNHSFRKIAEMKMTLIISLEQ